MMIPAYPMGYPTGAPGAGGPMMGAGGGAAMPAQQMPWQHGGTPALAGGQMMRPPMQQGRPTIPGGAPMPQAQPMQRPMPQGGMMPRRMRPNSGIPNAANIFGRL